MLLLENQTINTTGGQDTITVDFIHTQPDRLVWAEGTFAASTAVVLQVLPEEGSEWITKKTFTAADTMELAVPAKLQVRGGVSSAAASTSITMGIAGG